MTADELAALSDLAKHEAGRQYAQAVERHFDHAHRLLVEGKPDEAERIAKGAAILRLDARGELRP